MISSRRKIRLHRQKSQRIAAPTNSYQQPFQLACNRIQFGLTAIYDIMELNNRKLLIIFTLLLNSCITLHGSSRLTRLNKDGAIRFHKPASHFNEPSDLKRTSRRLTNPILCWYRLEHDTSEVCYHSVCLDVSVTKTIKECISVQCCDVVYVMLSRRISMNFLLIYQLQT